MVLITSSTLSVAISSGVVSLFTFLLFLCGYELQQQTVRSLQQAIRQPPPPRPTPTLPPAFQTLRVTQNEEKERPTWGAEIEVQNVAAKSGVVFEKGIPDVPSVEVPLVQTAEISMLITDNTQADTAAEVQLKRLAQFKKTAFASDEVDQHVTATEIETTADILRQDQPKVAYVLPLLTPSAVCGALYFSKQRTSLTKYKSTPIVLLYPSTWETSPDPESVSALELLRTATESISEAYGRLLLHPVQVNAIWSGHGMLEAQIVAELSRNRWEFDRLLYLRLPGIALDVSSLDWALLVSDLRRAWSPLSSSTGSSVSHSLTSPAVLMWSSSKGLMRPRGEMRRLATSLASPHINRHASEMEIEAKAASRGSAWVIFDEAELVQRNNEKEWFGGLAERFERARRDTCRGTDLLTR